MYSNNEKFINTVSGKGPSFSYQVLNYGFGLFLRNFNFESVVHQINCEILILVGEDDWINEPSHLIKLASLAPKAKLEILKNCGHFVAIDQHEKYIELIINTAKNISRTIFSHNSPNKLTKD